MATITTDTFLDDGTPRTAGESFTMNGAVLTIRTDTRVHIGAPAGMTGSIAGTTISSTLGGGVLLDARNVRWLAYDSGSGNVPAIGTIISQGGVEGYLLGVWADIDTAPTPAGDAMPTSGYLKFREVSGGSFSAGALTGIGANATGNDVVGWVEIAQRRSTLNIVPRLGFFRTRGDWFYLENTSGVANQLIKLPNNGGGAEAKTPAVWIETGVGTGEYESYPAIELASFIPANLSTDERCKFVCMEDNGAVRIGGNGTDVCGFIPPAGCKIRIPNIIGRQTNLASGDNLNLIPIATITARPRFATTSAGVIDIEYFLTDWYFNFDAAYNIKIKNSSSQSGLLFTNTAEKVEVDNYCNGAMTSINTLTTNSLTNGAEIKNSKFFRVNSVSSGHPYSMSLSQGIDLINCSFGVIQYARSTGNLNISQSQNINIDNVKLFATSLVTSVGSNIKITNLDCTDRLVGAVNSTAGKYVVQSLSTSNNILIDGITFGLNGLITEQVPYNGLLNTSGSSNITMRNVGTASNPVSVSPTAVAAYILADSGNSNNIRIQNCHLSLTRTRPILSINTTNGVIAENVSGTSAAQTLRGLNMIIKGIRANTLSTGAGASVYGSHWIDAFENDDEGRIMLFFNEPTEKSASQFTAVSLGLGSGFTSTGQLSMPNLTDEVIFEMPYFAQGHTGFLNVAPIITGTNLANFLVSYQIDKGTGYSGVWQEATAVILSAETGITPSVGIKLKLRFQVITANPTNALTFYRIQTSTTLLARTSLDYPLDYTNLSLSGLIIGSRVQLYDATNNVELFNGVATDSILTYSTPYVADFDLRVRVMKQDGLTAKKFLEFTELEVGLVGFSRRISYEDDEVYINNGIDGSTITSIEINDDSLEVRVDTGEITWGEIYAYETYWLTTEEGIRDEGRFIEAVDIANYKLFDFKIKNVSVPSLPLIIKGGYGVDGDTGETLPIIDITGGTIYCSPPNVVAYDNNQIVLNDLNKIKKNTDLIPAII